MAGIVSNEDRASAGEVLVANLKHAAAAAAEKELTILIEPINQRDMPGYFYSTVEPAIDIIERVKAVNLKLMFDVYHVAIAQGDVLTHLRKHIKHIGHVQIAAVPSRAEPDDGAIAYRSIFDALDDLGYDGWIGCEYRPRAGTDDGLVWTKALGVSL
jgi:hydroxypyruvate isomerase